MNIHIITLLPHLVDASFMLSIRVQSRLWYQTQILNVESKNPVQYHLLRLSFMVNKLFLLKLKKQRKLTAASQVLRSMFKCTGVARLLIASTEDTKIDAQVGVAKLSSNTVRS